MNIAVYCSARRDIAPGCFEDARTFGRWIGASGHTLIYGGLAKGLMEAVAQATADAGGKVVGMVPQSRLESIHPANTVSIHVDTLHERKQMMEQQADVFVALDGGTGTLDEVMSALASGFFFNEPKPILMLDRDGLYRPLIAMLEEMNRRGLVSRSQIDNITLCPDVASLIHAVDVKTPR